MYTGASEIDARCQSAEMLDPLKSPRAAAMTQNYSMAHGAAWIRVER